MAVVGVASVSAGRGPVPVHVCSQPSGAPSGPGEQEVLEFTVLCLWPRAKSPFITVSHVRADPPLDDSGVAAVLRLFHVCLFFNH